MDLNEAFENARQKELEKQFDRESIKHRIEYTAKETTCVGCYFNPCRCANSLCWLETLSSGV